MGVLAAGCEDRAERDRVRFDPEGWRLAPSSGDFAALNVSNRRGHTWSISCAQRPADIWVQVPDVRPPASGEARLKVGLGQIPLRAGPGDDGTLTHAVGSSTPDFLSAVSQGGPVELALGAERVRLPSLTAKMGAEFALECATAGARYRAVGGTCGAIRDLYGELPESGASEMRRELEALAEQEDCQLQP